MKHAVQIRRCSGARRDNHFRFRSSFVQPPPARRLSPFISNRESLRLEIHLNHTKQTPHHRSNRENNPQFSNHDQAACLPNLKISNRESLRRVRADDSARRNDEVIRVTHTKQTLHHRSNREKELCRGAGSPRPRIGPGFWANHAGRSENPMPHREGGEPPPLRPNGNLHGGKKNRNRRPPKVLRLKRGPIVCFV